MKKVTAKKRSGNATKKTAEKPKSIVIFSENDEDNAVMLDFLKKSKTHKGILNKTCKAVGISNTRYYELCKKYPAFEEEAERSRDAALDKAELKLYELVDEGDIKAITFLLKTRGKKRGYNLNPEPTTANSTEIATVSTPSVNYDILLASKIDELTRQLKEANKYSPELTIQIQQTAILLVKVDAMRNEILSENHQSVKIEVSREGNERMVVNQLDKLFLDYMSEAKANLRALGMNVDAKERRTDGEDTMFDRLSTIGGRPDD